MATKQYSKAHKHISDTSDSYAELSEYLTERLFGGGPKMGRYQDRQCSDGWIVGYTTQRIEHPNGEHDGKFGVMAYKPIGKGARSGNPRRWELTYLRSYAKRQAAKTRAIELIAQHDDDERWARAAAKRKEGS